MKIKSNMNCNSGFFGQNQGRMATAPYILIPAGATLEVDEATWDQFKDTTAIVESLKHKYIELVEEVPEQDDDHKAGVVSVIPNLLALDGVS